MHINKFTQLVLTGGEFTMSRPRLTSYSNRSGSMFIGDCCLPLEHMYQWSGYVSPQYSGAETEGVDYSMVADLTETSPDLDEVP